MKKFFTLSFIFFLGIQSAFAGWAVRDAFRQANENPVYYLGDSITLYWYVNANGWAKSVKKAGIGITESSLNWQDIVWDNEAGDGYGNNEGVKSVQFTANATGTWYYSLWLGSGTEVGDDRRYYNGSNQWNDGSPTFISSTFTVLALENPTNISNSPSGSQIDLSWNLWEGRRVMIVRSLTSGVSSDAPIQGHTYNVNDVLGTGTVIYHGFGTNFSDTDLSTQTGYTYTFYSENYNYYSDGSEVSYSTISTNIDLEPVSKLIISSTANQIDVRFSGSALLELFNINGQLIHSGKVENQFSQKVNPGIYILRINGKTHKVVVD